MDHFSAKSSKSKYLNPKNSDKRTTFLTNGLVLHLLPPPSMASVLLRILADCGLMNTSVKAVIGP